MLAIFGEADVKPWVDVLYLTASWTGKEVHVAFEKSHTPMLPLARKKKPQKIAEAEDKPEWSWRTELAGSRLEGNNMQTGSGLADSCGSSH